jgi:hypothetical protein
VIPACTPVGRCDVEVLDHPEWRTCARNDECMSVAIGCRYTPVRHADAAALTALAGSALCRAWRPEGPGACRAGVCLVPSMLAGADDPDHAEPE